MGEEKDAVRGLEGFGTTGRGTTPPGTGEAGGRGGERDPDRIRSDIERTREELGETVDEIKERLSRENIKAQVREATVGRAGQMADDTGRKAKAAYCNAVGASYYAMSEIVRNPLPAVLIPVSLIGTGLAWRMGGWKGGGFEDFEIEFEADFEEIGLEGDEMVKPLASDELERIAESHGRRDRRTAREAGGGMKEAARAVRERAEESTRRLQESAGRLGESVRERARGAGTRTRRTAGGRPSLLAVMAAVAGVAAGLLFPESQVERKYFGKARERLRMRIREAGQDVAATVRETAETAAEAAKRAAGE
jgi:ElaB/YqjD/DUF883 family membrane-anchored ribosome-binding protein